MLENAFPFCLFFLILSLKDCFFKSFSYTYICVFSQSTKVRALLQFCLAALFKYMSWRYKATALPGDPLL